jgi:hypothetical protein
VPLDAKDEVRNVLARLTYEAEFATLHLSCLCVMLSHVRFVSSYGYSSDHDKEQCQMIFDVHDGNAEAQLVLCMVSVT